MNVLIVCDLPILSRGIAFIIRDHYRHATITESEEGDHTHTGFQDLIIYCIEASQTDSRLLYRLADNKSRARKIVYDLTASDTTLLKCLQSGVDGYLSRFNNLQEVFQCIDQVLNGEKFYNNEVLFDLVLKDHQSKSQTDNADGYRLTPNEKRIAEMLVEGMKVSAIAKTLRKNITTISTVKSNIFKKLNINSVISLADRLRDEVK